VDFPQKRLISLRGGTVPRHLIQGITINEFKLGRLLKRQAETTERN
jgi:hypothetical protein